MHAYISVFYVLTSHSMENRYSFIVCIKTNFGVKKAIYDIFFSAVLTQATKNMGLPQNLVHIACRDERVV
jgi:hypothetical protein